MKKLKKLSYLYLPVLLISSCSQDDNGLIMSDDDTISFVLSMPGVSSRSTYDAVDSLYKYGFTVSAFCPEKDADADGILPIHCENAIAVREVDGVFRSDSCRWPGNRDEKNGHLKFFAFHPSITEMRKRAGVAKECFIYSNLTKKDASGVSYDYRLTKFRVAPDISKQVDFVTATGQGNKTTDLYRALEIRFEHQLCGVNISVWGGSALYDIEVAGVRIGGTVVEADFNLAAVTANPVGDENTIGSWIIGDKPKYGHVDYVFTAGDKVIGINATDHNNKDNVASIMGKGGRAMVIPHTHDKWDYKNDRTNGKNGMYFSALIRMSEREGDRHVIFPSTDPDSRPYVVFLLVDKSDGTVIRRLSSAEYDSYTAPDGQEKRAYGWAAVPVYVAWEPGYTYSYILDYTHAVGLHDPVDDNPAIPIIDWEGGIGVTTTDEVWGDGETAKIEEGGWGANTNNTAPDGTIWWK